MKKEYDFSKGVRGKFCQRDTKFNIPIYLDEDVHRFVQEIADAKKAPVSDIVNRLIKSDMKTMEIVR